jgi:hypothetical protein
MVSETAVQLHFLILDETLQSLSKFNATGRSVLIKSKSPGEKQEPTVYLKKCITCTNEYLVDEVPGRDLVGHRIRNTENAHDKVVGISLRCRGLFNPFVGGGKQASHLKEVVPADAGSALHTSDL